MDCRDKEVVEKESERSGVYSHHDLGGCVGRYCLGLSAGTCILCL